MPIISSPHRKHRLPDQRLALLKTLCFIPGCRRLLDTFAWQTEGAAPARPRAHRFLRHCRRTVDAVIQQVSGIHAGGAPGAARP